MGESISGLSGLKIIEYYIKYHLKKLKYLLEYMFYAN